MALGGLEQPSDLRGRGFRRAHAPEESEQVSLTLARERRSELVQRVIKLSHTVVVKYSTGVRQVKSVGSQMPPLHQVVWLHGCPRPTPATHFQSARGR